MGLFLIGMAVIFSYSVGNVSAAPIYVSTHGNNSWNGLSPNWVNGTLNGPKATIKNATSIVNKNGTIYVASGNYKENNIVINKNMKIIGVNKDNTIINGNNKGNIFTVDRGTTILLQNLMLENGKAIIGGSIKNNGNLTIKNCILIKNTATNNNYNYGGGAIFNTGSLTVITTIFNQNNAPIGKVGNGYGGAIYNLGKLNINSSSFIKNTATYSGGAIYNGNNLTITNTTFTNNIVKDNGGAIYNSGKTASIKNCSFIDNQVTTKNNGGDGGAITNEINNVLRVTESTFISNKSYKGGAISNGGTAYVHFNRFVKNSASHGSAIYNNAFYNHATVNATLNWWGTNNKTIISKEIFNTNTGGRVIYNPWIILTLKVNPSTLNIGEKSVVTAELLYSNKGVYQNPEFGIVPYSTSAHFISTKGTINNSKFINGIAKGTLTNLTIPEVVTVSATVDGQTIKRTVTVKKIVLK